MLEFGYIRLPFASTYSFLFSLILHSFVLYPTANYFKVKKKKKSSFSMFLSQACLSLCLQAKQRKITQSLPLHFPEVNSVVDSLGFRSAV